MHSSNLNHDCDEKMDANESLVDLPELENLERSITETEEKVSINKQKLLCGVLLVIGIGISWASSTQFAQRVQTDTTVSIPPFALMWLTTSFKIFCAIPVLIRRLSCSACRGAQHQQYPQLASPLSVGNATPKSPKINSRTGWNRGHKPIAEIFNTDVSQYGTTASAASASYAESVQLPSNIIVRLHEMSVTPNNCKVCAYYILFYSLWTGANYSYLRALQSNSATIVTALFSSNNMFIYVLSIFVLNELFSWLRMAAVLTAIFGICFIALSNHHHSSVAFIGSMLAILSSLFAAFYKVYFKKVFGDMHVLLVCQFLAYIGLFNLLFMWPIIWILDLYGFETLPHEPLSEWPWFFLLGSALCGLTFDFLINFGIAFTYPLFIALGIIIGIPFNLVADVVFNHLLFGLYQLIGVLCIVLGFFIIVVTDLHGAGKGSSASFRK